VRDDDGLELGEKDATVPEQGTVAFQRR